MQKNPFADLLRPYFDWLSQEFEHLADEAIRNKVQPDHIAQDFLSDDRRRVNFNRYMMPEIKAAVHDFWSQNSDVIHTEIMRLPGLKARFGGDIGPQPSQKLFERLGIYYDSVIVPDPILRCITTLGPAKRTDYYTLKYCISHVLQRDVYLADVYPPVAVLFAEKNLLEQKPYSFGPQSRIDAVIVANKIFGQNFENEQDTSEFFRKLGTAKAVARAVVRPELFRFDDRISNDPLEQLEALQSDLRSDWDESRLPSEWQGSQRIWIVLAGRMFQANDVLQAAIELGAHPVVQAPISFHWLVTKLKCTTDLIQEASNESYVAELPVTNALLSKELKWLSNVPLDALMRIRSQGFLGELRETISSNLSELVRTPSDELERVCRQVDNNLQIAFNRHQEKIHTLNETLIRRFAIAAPSLLLSIGGAIQPLLGGTLPPWVSIAATLGGSVSLTELVSSIATNITERRRLAKTPVGILWHAKDEK